MKPKYIIIGIFVGWVSCIAIYVASQRGWSKKNSIEAKITLGNNEILKLVKSESKVRDAAITDIGILYVSVIDDGTSRSGYASYICEVISGGSVNHVKVVKFGSMNDPDRDSAYGVLLGESYCK